MLFLLKKIKPRDISVVVQGAYDEGLISRCLESLHRHLPGAQTILSTWEGCDITKAAGNWDVLIQSEDPGAYPFVLGNSKLNNINRLIKSTQLGVKKASRKYILKLRSDMEVRNTQFLQHYDRYKKRSKYSIFSAKILCNLIYSLRYEIRENRKIYLPFHVSDWWYFGYNEDVKKLFSCPLVKEPEFSSYFTETENLIAKRTRRMSPEQYITSYCASTNFSDIQFRDARDVSNRVIRQSDLFIWGNFLPLHPQQSGLEINKQMYSCTERVISDPVVKNGLWYFDVWKQLYKES